MQKMLPWRGPFEAEAVYVPEKHPGFTAWVTAFVCPNGQVGLSFDETVHEKNPTFRPATLELAEAACVPVSYGAVECGSPETTVYRVFLRSEDGLHFRETGRCLRSKAPYACAALADSSLLGFDVPRRNDDDTAWADWLRVLVSSDGGSTWRETARLLQGTVPYLWRVRTLKDGTILLLLSLQGEPWGVGRDRMTRHTHRPGLTDLQRIQTCFLTTRDGVHFSGPHYILPGIAAHEYDAVETADGLLFIAGDVQGTPVGRQHVRRYGSGWLNSTMETIRDGAPPDPQLNPQGGHVPETIVRDPASGCLIGYRRNQGYSLSADEGENWVRVAPDAGIPKLYQPVMLALPNGLTAVYGHVGGDQAFGMSDMCIWGHVLRPDCAEDLPQGTHLTIARCLSEDSSRYLNAFTAHLTCGGSPLACREITFRTLPFWKEDGTVNTASLTESKAVVTAVTDEDGRATVRFPAYDQRGDVHLAYRVDTVWTGDACAAPCISPSMTVLALTPARNFPFPWDAYFAEGVLFLSPSFMKDFPLALSQLKACAGQEELPEGILPEEALRRLEASGVLWQRNGRLCWLPSVHAPRPLDDVKPMLSGDDYR